MSRSARSLFAALCRTRAVRLLLDRRHGRLRLISVAVVLMTVLGLLVTSQAADARRWPGFTLSSGGHQSGLSRFSRHSRTAVSSTEVPAVTTSTAGQQTTTSAPSDTTTTSATAVPAPPTTAETTTTVGPDTSSVDATTTTRAPANNQTTTTSVRTTTTQAAAAPAVAGSFPSASSTGVPAGTSLRSSGTVRITTPGAVVEGLDVYGMIEIAASNVTVRNSRVVGGDGDYYLIKVKDGVTNVVIEDVELNGRGRSNSIGAIGIYGAATVRRANIYGVTDGICPSSGSVLTDNYIHALGGPGDPHYDGIQIDGDRSNITIDHNTVENDYTQTSAIMIDNYFGPIANIAVRNNWLGGGGYTVYSTGGANSTPVSGVSFTNNSLKKGQWGYADIERNTPVWSGNIDVATGKLIPTP